MEGSREIHRTKSNDSNTGAGQPIVFKMNAQIGKENAIYKVITSRLFNSSFITNISIQFTAYKNTLIPVLNTPVNIEITVILIRFIVQIRRGK